MAYMIQWKRARGYDFTDGLFFKGRMDKLGRHNWPKINYPVLKQPRLRLGTARGAAVFALYGAVYPAEMTSNVEIAPWKG